jgi:hypothetical protein
MNYRQSFLPVVVPVVIEKQSLGEGHTQVLVRTRCNTFSASGWDEQQALENLSTEVSRGA